jgi:PAS domain S-box-containing protein
VSIGGEDLIVGIWSDITERKRAEQALRISEATLGSIFRAAPVGIGLVVDRVLKKVNDTICNMVGRSADELVGQSARMLYPTEDDYNYVGREKYRQIGLRGTGTIETRWLRKDGQIIDILLSSTPIDPKRLSEGVTFTALDITDRKLAEQAAIAAREALLTHQRSETERVQRELEKVQERLVNQTRLATIGQLAGSIAHELRNPLGAARNAAYFLKRYADIDDEDTIEHLDIIEEEIRTADRIITDLMDMTRAKPPARQTVNIGELLEEVAARSVFDSGVQFSMSLAPEPLNVLADPAQLKQVFANLFTNAIQAMNGEGELHVDGRCAAGFGEVFIRDTGPGIDPEDRDRVFDALFTTKAKGTGLGLTICREIVSRNGGTIQLVDEAGRGTTFLVRLPMAGD